MCGLFPSKVNEKYLRDLTRGRAYDWDRFAKLKSYAERRWRKTKDMHYAKFWLEVLSDIRRRSPR